MTSVLVLILLLTIVYQNVEAATRTCTNGNIKCGGSAGGSDCVFGKGKTPACKCSGALEANCNFRDSKCYCS
uniref:Uncharacterized protein n=1 Tax=Panagrolaimus davidi TaxID=227884 RepID=A0A914PY47_9BILA